MVTSILMGMGMPCTPAYIVAVTIGGPALQAMGIDVLSSHLFVFYFAILAEITPPVSIASYCGAAIAGSDPMKTGLEALRLAVVGFIIPYIFIYNPALMLNGSFIEIVTLVISTLYIVVALAAAFRGYLHRLLTKVEQGFMGALAVVLIVLTCNLSFMHNALVQTVLLASMGLIIFLVTVKKLKTKRAGTLMT
jgi:TRAP-type uncharacterized transport system fused permease subunit